MPMSTMQAGAAAPGAPAERVVDEQDKKLAADWLKRIDAALTRKCVADAHKSFERNRKLLRGIDPDAEGKRMRSNLYFAELAAMRPQIYAKDPEFAVRPSEGVPIEQVDAIKRFGETAEVVLTHMLVREARLKKRAKRLLTAAYTCKVGWWKVCWQEDKRSDPLIENQIKDTQDNLNRLQTLRQQLDDPSMGADQDLKIAELQQTLAGLQSQAEVKVARGITLDFVLSEDVLVLDASVRELTDYERASALGHRIWMTRSKYRETFGYDCAKGKTYAEKSGEMAAQSGAAGQGKEDDLLCVWEVWDQASNRVFQVCDGEEGFCSEPFSPDWTGKRWYPFFALAFNEVDGSFYPLSDVELIEPLVREYNESRDDFVRDRRECLPLNIARKGGSLTDADLQRIKNRQGGDLLLVEGIGGQPISNDIWSGQLGQIRPENYDTQPARGDIEQILGGGDAARGSVLKAKTATEAEILSQGLRGRSAERTDIMEDLLGDVGGYVLQVCLRKLTLPEVQRIAGMDAAWPSLQPEQVFEQVLVEVRGGSTGKPDRLQEQDRWTKLMPVIEKCVTQVGELRAKGQEPLAAALIELTRETLRRFDERIDINQFLPEPAEGEQQGQPQDPLQSPQVAQLMEHGKQMIGDLQAQVQQLQQQLADKTADRELDLEKARLSAETDIQKAHIAAEAQTQIAVMRGAVDSQQSAPGDVSTELAAALPAALDDYLAQEAGEPMNGDLS